MLAGKLIVISSVLDILVETKNKNKKKKKKHHNNPKYLDRRALANNVGLDQKSKNTLSDQSLHCLQII